MSKEKVVVKSKQSSLAYLVDLLTIGIVIGWVAYVSGCESCKNTNPGTECFGKSAGSMYKELNEGFRKGFSHE